MADRSDQGFGMNNRNVSKFAGWWSCTAWVLIVVSVPVWCTVFVAPFLPLSVAERSAIVAAAIVAGEMMFWLGVAMLGPELAAKVKKPNVNNGQSYRGKRVAVVGATGGLGRAITQALIREGAEVVALVRDGSKLGTEHEGIAQCILIDMRSYLSIHEAAIQIGPLDVVIVATGMDVRKPLQEHTQEDLEHQWELNLRGPINVTKEFLANMNSHGVIAHLGGFGDGRLALPYYSANVSTRAGLAAFCESMNRELGLEGKDVTVSYLCPEPADTEAERPFRELWTKMGTPPIAPEKVADFVLESVLMKKPLAIMGRQTWVVAKINRMWVFAADWIGLRSAGKQLKAVFGGGGNNALV
jgi:NAD(P)-dependent dehydrogenase (short-subunit alcohol dehydrogenase family)